ncbi:Thymidylate synthase [Pseudomonas syringae pv. aceris]|nr:Thymidylate synthase [Pseudomonas syringae pv. aceris]
MPFTLIGPCEFREEIRKSRFITLAAPIASPADAQAFIEQHSDLNATHNCWAWKLGGQYRSNDDGEPGGTAGRPILAAIEAQEFDQVVVLVIRWYGGIQLGTVRRPGPRLWRRCQQMPAAGRASAADPARVVPP